MAELVRALPPIFGRGLDLGDPLAFLERDLVVFPRIVAAVRIGTIQRCSQ